MGKSVARRGSDSSGQTLGEEGGKKVSEALTPASVHELCVENRKEKKREASNGSCVCVQTHSHPGNIEAAGF
ncbi:hypothetical protein F2P81_017068 [Scophthalmus maximus]|uniref:Uncharacterized protein n=1 Tax=Scophthalmus maximus TaxID=52904 RepID=A0A6A4SAV5_SCOMX|nr:hypothetical protein F2P81_017068 [Scophthalmus maximus]